MHSLDGSDVQHLLAVADAGSLAAGARALGVNHTTVLRRIVAFEERLGVRLFDRHPTGYVMTPAGEELARAARAMADALGDVERRLAGRDAGLTGTVRVTTTDTLAFELVPRALAKFQSAHPEIELELATATQAANLSKRDADIAVRVGAKPPAHLVGRRVARVAYAIYAAPSYDAKHARSELSRYDWLLPDDSLSGTTVARWADKTLKGARVRLRADTFTALANASAQGIGLVALPCFFADAVPGLRRVHPVVEELASDLWVLTHEDVRSAARIRALVDHLVAELSRARPRLDGRARP